MNADQLLPLIRDLFSRHPEFVHHEAWEIQWLLFALNYSDELEDEAEIAAALKATQAARLADLDQLLLDRFGAKVRRGLALDLSRRHGARGRAKSLTDTATESKGAAWRAFTYGAGTTGERHSAAFSNPPTLLNPLGGRGDRGPWTPFWPGSGENRVGSRRLGAYEFARSR